MVALQVVLLFDIEDLTLEPESLYKKKNFKQNASCVSGWIFPLCHIGFDCKINCIWTVFTENNSSDFKTDWSLLHKK